METAYMEHGTSVDKGENARLSSFVGAIAIADLVKTTLGPKGMDKILQSINPATGNTAANDISVTNDGATILKSVQIDNAAAKVLVDIAKVQDDEIGDGTTSVTVLCGELLRQGEILINQRIHPTTIIDGWRKATKIAKDALEQSTIQHDGDDNDELLRKDLINIAQTTLSSKLLTHEKKHFAELAVNAVLRLKGSNNLDHIQIIKKKGGSLKDSYLDDGFLLPSKEIGIGQKTRLENAKILLANTSMDTDKIKIYGSKVKVDSLSKVDTIEKAEKEKMEKKCQKIINHGCNVFINRQLIYNYPESIFTAAGIVSIEHADFEGIERLAAVTGGEVTSTFDNPDLVTLGEADLLEQIMIGEDKVIRLSGCKSGEACTIVLRGSSKQYLDEAERSLHDALCILISTIKDNNKRVVYGGGCTEIIMSKAIERQVPTIEGKASIAMSGFATALQQIPHIIADNGGYDSVDLITKLIASHTKYYNDNKDDSNSNKCCCPYGLDMYNGCVGNMDELGVVESYRSKLQVLISAAEAAEMILRVDDIIKCAPRQREDGMGGMPPGY